MSIMAARPRLYFDVDDRLRWAMKLKMGKDNLESLAALGRLAVEQFVSKELSEVDARIAQGETPKQTPSKRGRKPKKKS